MEPKPVTRIPAPGYPTRQQTNDDRFFLSRHLPPFWRFTGVASIALSVSFAGLGAEPGPQPDTPVAQKQTGAKQMGALVAPVFEHGTGRGAIGCMAVNPPVFLPEDEAMAVISDELAKHGVRLSSQHVALLDVVIPRRIMESRSVDGQYRYEIRESKAQGTTLLLDGVDEEKQIAVEFVDECSYEELGGPREMSTAGDYDMIGVARSVARQVRQEAKQPLRLGIFYDPLLGPDRKAVTEEEWTEDYATAREKVETLAIAKSKELLRLQVQDFVNWLKEQKAL